MPGLRPDERALAGPFATFAGVALSDILPPKWEVWLDGGHNPAAGLALAQHVQDEWYGTPVDLVVGMLASKDAGGFLEHLVKGFDVSELFLFQPVKPGVILAN